MKVLLIEDNKEIANNIQEFLGLEWYTVAWAGRGDEWCQTAIAYDFDIILLDLSLPFLDGIEICKKIREKKQTPIIMITARESIEQRIAWLDVWADDYIVKPFDLWELEARIRAHTRNIHKQKKYEKNNISISLETRSFSRDGTDVNITQKEFLILEILLKKAPYVVSRTDVIDYVWGSEDERFSADGKLDVYISNLRSKFWKNLIETIKWVGYKIDI